MGRSDCRAPSAGRGCKRAYSFTADSVTWIAFATKLTVSCRTAGTPDWSAHRECLPLLGRA